MQNRNTIAKLWLQYREHILIASVFTIGLLMFFWFKSCSAEHNTIKLARTEAKSEQNKTEIQKNLSEQKKSTENIAIKADNTTKQIIKIYNHVKANKKDITIATVRDTTYDAMRSHLDTVQPAP